MAVRDTMAPLIDKVRLMIGDEAGASQQFSNQQIQDALDVYKLQVRYAMLVCDPDRAPGGILNYNHFYAKSSGGALVGDWESDAILSGPSYQTLSPATTDYITGTWTFNGPPPGQLLPVFVTGQTYDTAGAARDLCLKWASALARSYNFSANGVSFNRGQMVIELRNMAREFERDMRPQVASLTRSDIHDNSGYASAPTGLIGLDW